MTRLGILVVSLAFLAVSAGARAEQAADWAVVCDNSDPAAVSHCYLSLLAGVTGAGESFGRAEINVQGDTIIVTDYCYDSYCVFVQADELVEQFRKGEGVDISLYDGRGAAAVKEHVTLIGFTKAHRTYLERIGE
jgi:invasion protein IalB